jgi:hypothetical protein
MKKHFWPGKDSRKEPKYSALYVSFSMLRIRMIEQDLRIQTLKMVVTKYVEGSGTSV